MRIVLGIMFILCSLCLEAQNGFIIVKKKHKTVRYFARDSHITFQLENQVWISGIVTRVLRDSFYLTQEIIRYYQIGTDTLRYRGLGFALKDIRALPTKRMQTVYRGDETVVVPGNERFVWFRNGLFCRLAGAGYVTLNITNDLYREEPPFTSKKLPGLGIGALAFLVGEYLNRKFDPYLRIGKKYQLDAIVF